MFPNINSKEWHKSSSGMERILVGAGGCLDSSLKVLEVKETDVSMLHI